MLGVLDVILDIILGIIFDPQTQDNSPLFFLKCMSHSKPK